MYLYWKRYDWKKIVEEEIYCSRLAQLSTNFLFTKFAFLKIDCLNKFWKWQMCIYFVKDASERKLLRNRFVVLVQHNSSQIFFFRNSHFWKLYVWTNFEIYINVFILKKMRLRENCWGRNLLCTPSATQHKFSFYEIRIFENCMFKQILKVSNVYLFWKGCVWEIIVGKEIFVACLAELSTTSLFTKFAFLKIICLNKFWNWQKCIYYGKDASERKLLRKRLVVLV